jgi:hypothetical protein
LSFEAVQGGLRRRGVAPPGQRLDKVRAPLDDIRVRQLPAVYQARKGPELEDSTVRVPQAELQQPGNGAGVHFDGANGKLAGNGQCVSEVRAAVVLFA